MLLLLLIDVNCEREERRGREREDRLIQYNPPQAHREGEGEIEITDALLMLMFYLIKRQFVRERTFTNR